MVAHEHEVIVERWFHELLTEGNLDLIDELLVPHFVSYDPSDRVSALGRESYKTWLKWYLATFSEADWLIHDVITEGEKVVVRYSSMVTYRGGLFDIPARGQRVKEMGVFIFQIEDGKIQALWSALCDLDVVLDLGAVLVMKD